MALAKYSIGAKIFGAFAVMSAIIGVTGLAGYGVLSAAGNIAVTTFDGPLMAINYARAAHNDFMEMQLAELRFEHAASASTRGCRTSRSISTCLTICSRTNRPKRGGSPATRSGSS